MHPATLLLPLALATTQPPAWGDWREVRDERGTLLGLRWIDAEGNVHNRFPLSRFPEPVEARTWTPARTPSGEMCWAIRTDEWVQTWQPRDARGRKWSSVDEFVRSGPLLPQTPSYGVVTRMMERSAAKAQHERPGCTAQGNGPMTPEDYDAIFKSPPVIDQPLDDTPPPIAGVFALALIIAIFLILPKLLKSKEPPHDDHSDEHLSR